MYVVQTLLNLHSVVKWLNVSCFYDRIKMVLYVVRSVFNRTINIKGGTIVKKLDAKFEYLSDMYEDSYYPTFLVNKIKENIMKLVHFIEEGNHTIEEVLEKLDEMTVAINELQDEFYEHDSEIETVARDSIAITVEEILQYFEIDIDIEEALRERDW